MSAGRTFSGAAEVGGPWLIEVKLARTRKDVSLAGHFFCKQHRKLVNISADSRHGKKRVDCGRFKRRMPCCV